jgi:fructan beta-fructosidase
MSNWLYGTQVPTTAWRSAMTVPRELKLASYKGSIIVRSVPVEQLNDLKGKTFNYNNVSVGGQFDLGKRISKIPGQCLLKMESASTGSFTINLANAKNEKLVIGFDKNENQYFIDRSYAGIVDFNKAFAGKFVAPRLSGNKTVKLTLVVDRASIELFADDGATVMTCIFFPSEPFDNMRIQSDKGLQISSLSLTPLRSIW